MELREPDPRLQASYLDALDELIAEGNGRYLDLVLEPDGTFPGVAYTRDALADPVTFADFCAFARARALEETPRPRGWVTSTDLWMVEGEQVVGRISFRHRLTPWLLELGGHIGYVVRPSARRRGHATRAVALILPLCAARGVDPVLITCDEDNVASRRVIEANGGTLEDVRGGKLRFWVPAG